jgi:hypothetical protein
MYYRCNDDNNDDNDGESVVDGIVVLPILEFLQYVASSPLFYTINTFVGDGNVTYRCDVYVVVLLCVVRSPD